jgi:uncharacterized protein
MSQAAAVRIPLLEETGHTPESLLNALRNERELPGTEIAFATLYADAIEPDVVAVVERAQREDLDIASGRLLFRGIHILGGRRLTAAYRPLLAMLRGPQDRVEALLGDAVTENLSRILAGLFDGDEQPLYALVADANVDSFVRDAALRALAVLAFEGRIDRTAFETFLVRFDEARLAAAEDEVMWHGWMTAVAVLGLTALAPRVRAAFADGRIAPEWYDESDFDVLLNEALDRPNDRARLADEHMGYIDDVLVALERFIETDDADDGAYDADDGDDVFTDDAETTWPSWSELGLPTRDPYRDVGRNDPCPCGSGKKFKKCCLQH